MIDPFEMIAEPNRRRILDALLKRESSVNDLVRRLPLSQPAISKHLRLLRESGLVEARIEGQRRIYRIHAAPLGQIQKWLEPYRSLIGKARTP